MAYKSNRIEFECEYCGGKCFQPSSQYNRNKHHNEFHKKYGKYNFTEEDYYEWNKIKVAC